MFRESLGAGATAADALLLRGADQYRSSSMWEHRYPIAPYRAV